MHSNSHLASRRQFLQQSGCGAYVFGLAALCPAMTQKVFAVQDDERVVARQKWGRIEKLAENFWAIVSTLDEQDFTTVCNGGIIAGRDRVLAIESFMQPKGATWVAEWSRKLTGRWPTDVVITHYHGDHSAGWTGYFQGDQAPDLWVTKATYESVQKDIAKKNQQLEQDKQLPKLPRINPLNGEEPTKIDLGQTTVRLTPRQGHTNSDVTVEQVDPNILFCGDLFFNRMVPNYSDSLPATLTRQVETLIREAETQYVPGHGPIAGRDDLQLYLEFLKHVEQAARKFHSAGTPVDQAAKEFELTDKFENWYIYAPTVIPNAMKAWYRELTPRLSFLD